MVPNRARVTIIDIEGGDADDCSVGLGRSKVLKHHHVFYGQFTSPTQSDGDLFKLNDQDILSVQGLDCVELPYQRFPVVLHSVVLLKILFDERCSIRSFDRVGILAFQD